MMPKNLPPGADGQVIAGCAYTYPSCTFTVGRARLLYGILQSAGMDNMREIKAMW